MFYVTNWPQFKVLFLSFDVEGLQGTIDEPKGPSSLSFRTIRYPLVPPIGFKTITPNACPHCKVNPIGLEAD